LACGACFNYLSRLAVINVERCARLIMAKICKCATHKLPPGNAFLSLTSGSILCARCESQGARNTLVDAISALLSINFQDAVARCDTIFIGRDLQTPLVISKANYRVSTSLTFHYRQAGVQRRLFTTKRILEMRVLVHLIPGAITFCH
jgi:hypothetical protein